jgi:hypothetical protein
VAVAKVLIMHDFKGAHLFVDFGASKTRRRPKGFGHGVRQVQIAGTGKAVIIHAATGHQLWELEATFADGGYSATDFSSMSSLTTPNRSLDPMSTESQGN